MRQQPPFRQQLLVCPSTDLKTGESTVLAEGRDFYSAPRLNANSTKASYISRFRFRNAQMQNAARMQTILHRHFLPAH